MSAQSIHTDSTKFAIYQQLVSIKIQFNLSSSQDLSKCLLSLIKIQICTPLKLTEKGHRIKFGRIRHWIVKFRQTFVDRPKLS